MPGAPWRSLLDSRDRRHVGAEAALTLPVTLAFYTWVFGSAQVLPLAFLALLASALVGSRFSPLVGMAHTVPVTAITVEATMDDTGPFSAATDKLVQANLVQLFLLAVTTIVITCAMAACDCEHLRQTLVTSEATAREQSELLHGVAHDLSDGLVIIDEHGAVLMENAAARA